MSAKGQEQTVVQTSTTNESLPCGGPLKRRQMLLISTAIGLRFQRRAIVTPTTRKKRKRPRDAKSA